MEPDFSGWATKANLKCSDGRTIMKDAFAHQDNAEVPVVWGHNHTGPDNVLGFAKLMHRDEGVWCDVYLNNTDKGQTTKEIVQHGDVKFLSIYANQLVEKSKQVFHGMICEVSVVLKGANPGAKIEQVRIAHSNDPMDDEVIEDAAVITTGVPVVIEHAEESSEEGPEETLLDIYESMNDKQKDVTHYMVDKALEQAGFKHSDENSEENSDENSEESSEENSEENADENSEENESEENSDENNSEENSEENNSDENNDEGSEENNSENNEGDLNHQEGVNNMNVFDQNKDTQQEERPTLSHDQLETIVTDGWRLGSLKQSFLAHAQEYGVEDIDILFPDAKALTNSPEIIGRRVEWVADVLAKTKHAPFSRIKSTAVDLTADEARAKGYVKGTMKKDEIIKLLKRVTTPTTIYKKQKLDRDDIVDITEIDVVSWLKAEMRVMLDEEIARAILVGDGREPDDEDKINEDHIRPIAYDDEMYAHRVNLIADSTPAQTIEAIVRSRRYYKGTGTPTLYTTDEILTDLMLDKDTLGRRYYNTEAELAAALRVDKIITVEAMEVAEDVVGIIVNLADYTIGATQGGQVSMFDDFDIDYNQQKYLIETRISGALTKPKSAIVIRRAPGNIIVPTQPTYNSGTHVITIPAQTGVIYSIDGADKTAGAQPAIVETTEVEARPAAGYSFPHDTDSDWVFVY